MIFSFQPEFDLLQYVYPEGFHDAEAMFVDDSPQNIYIISKKWYRSLVYLFPFPQSIQNTDTLIYLGSLPFPFLNENYPIT
jgi:hypothetical protein